MTDVELRPLMPADLEFAVDLTAREGWAGSRPWFATLTAYDPTHCLIAERDGRPVAMITGTRFAATAWIGNLIVVPEERRRGLGERLMRIMLDRLIRSGIHTVRLEADPPGINIYRRLGFVEEGVSRRFRLETRDLAPPLLETRTLEEGLSTVAALDADAFGDDRVRMLAMLRGHAVAASATPATGPPCGFIMVVPTVLGVSIGPCVAADSSAAETLFRSALGSRRGAVVTFGVMEHNRAAGDLAASLGFVETAPSIRMVWGERAHAGDTTRIWAIANGAVG